MRDEERQEDEGRGLDVTELRRLLEHGPRAWTKKDGELALPWRRAWAFIATLLWTGMRFGEAAALEWQDLDLQHAPEPSTIRVRRAVWHGTVDHPKARASKRVIVIPAELADTLREHRAAMLRDQQTGVSTALVFPSRRPGKGHAYVTNAHARKAMLRALEKAKIGRRVVEGTGAKWSIDGRPVVHVLRHTFNNVLRQSAPELVRQALIGHADEANNERYSKVGIDEKAAAVAKVVRLVKGGA